MKCVSGELEARNVNSCVGREDKMMWRWVPHCYRSGLSGLFSTFLRSPNCTTRLRHLPSELFVHDYFRPASLPRYPPERKGSPQNVSITCQLSLKKPISRYCNDILCRHRTKYIKSQPRYCTILSQVSFETDVGLLHVVDQLSGPRNR